MSYQQYIYFQGSTCELTLYISIVSRSGILLALYNYLRQKPILMSFNISLLHMPMASISTGSSYLDSIQESEHDNHLQALHASSYTEISCFKVIRTHPIVKHHLQINVKTCGIKTIYKPLPPPPIIFCYL